MAAPIRNYSLVFDAELNTAQVTGAVRTMVADVRNGAADAGRAWDGLNTTVRGHASIIATATTALKGYFAIVAAQAAPNALKIYADTWTSIGNRLRLVTDSATALGAAQNDVFQIATRTHQPLAATAELYQRIAQNAGKLHLTQQQIAQVVTTISKGVALSGVDAQTAERGIVQLAQGLAAGTLRGQDLKSVLDQLPGVSQALAAGLGTDIAGLRALAEAGKLTSEQVIQAFQNVGGTVDQQFSTLKSTISAGFTDIETNAIRYIGTLNEAINGSKVFGTVLEAVANHMNIVAAAVGAVGVYKLTQLFRGAAIGAGEMAKSMVSSAVAAVQGSSAQDELTRGLLRRADAERFVAVQAAQSARANVLEASAAVDVARAEKVAADASLRAAATAGEKRAARAAATVAAKAASLAERELAAAQTTSTIATDVAAKKAAALRVAQESAAASSLTLAGASRAVLGFLGGPVGLALTVASVAAGWLLFRDSTDQATQSLVDLQTPLDQAIAKFKELGEAQKLKVKLDLGDKIDEQKDAVDKAFTQLQSMATVGVSGSAQVGQLQAVDALRKQFDAGKLSVSELSAEMQKFIRQTEGMSTAGTYLDRQLQTAAAAAEGAAQKQHEYQDRLDELNGKSASVAAAVATTTNAMNAQGAAAGASADDWAKYLAGLQDSANQAGVTAHAMAVMQAKAKGFSDQQAELAGVIADQGAAWKTYQEQVAKGDQKGANSTLATLDHLTQIQVKMASVLRATQELADLPGKVDAAYAKGDLFGGTALKTQLDKARAVLAGKEVYNDIADAANAASLSHAINVDRTPSKASSQQHDAQQQTIADIKARIDAQNQLAEAYRKYGAQAEQLTDGDKLVLKLQQQIAVATDARTKSNLGAQLAQAQQLQTAEHATRALQAQVQAEAQLKQLRDDAAKAATERGRQNDADIAALSLGDSSREAQQRQDAIYKKALDDYAQYRSRIESQVALGAEQKQQLEAQYWDFLEKRRADDLKQEASYQARRAATLGSATVGMDRALDNYVSKAADIASQTEGLFTNAFQGMEDSLVNFVTTGKLSFTDLASSILSDLVRIEARILMSQALQSIMGSMFGSYGGEGTNTFNSSGFVSQVGGRFANGGVFSSPSLSAYSGQIVNSPTLFKFATGAGLMGEAGPEAIMPLSRTSDGKLGVKTQGGGGVDATVNMTINVNSGSDSTTTAGQQADSLRAFADRMKAVAKQTIADEQRPGGTLWRMAHA